MNNKYYREGVRLALTYMIKDNIIPNDCVQIVYNNIVNNIINKNKNNIVSIIEFNIYYKYNNIIIDKDIIYSFFQKKLYNVIKYIVDKKLYKNIISAIDLLIYCMYSDVDINIFNYIYNKLKYILPENWNNIIINYILDDEFIPEKKLELFNKYFNYYEKNDIYFYIGYDRLFNIAFNRYQFLNFLSANNNIIVNLDYEQQDIYILIELLNKPWPIAASIYYNNYLCYIYDSCDVYNYICKHFNMNDYDEDGDYDDDYDCNILRWVNNNL